MTLVAKQFENSNYIILSDGRAARLLKPQKIHQQTYVNFIINTKMKRVNIKELTKLFNEQPEDEGLRA